MDFNKRPLSWSAISSFRYDPEQWHKKYILGEKQGENATMTFGKLVGERLAREPGYLPQIERLEGGIYEYELRFKIANIPIIGFIDFLHLPTKNLKEFKTGKSWDKEKADNHDQLKLYALGLLTQDSIRPEELHIELISLETEARGDFTMTFVKNMKPVIHVVKLTTRDVLIFGAQIIKTVKEMKAYADSYPLAYKKQ